MKHGVEVLGRKVVNLFLKFRIMSNGSDRYYYAVGRGREIGIYETWKDCKTQIEGIANAKFKKFYSLEEAQEFVNFWKNYFSPSKKTTDSDNVVSNCSKGGKLVTKRGKNEDNIQKVNEHSLTKINVMSSHKSSLGNAGKKKDSSKFSYVLGNNGKETGNSKFSSFFPHYNYPYISPLPNFKQFGNYSCGSLKTQRNQNRYEKDFNNSHVLSSKVRISHSKNCVDKKQINVDGNSCSVVKSIETPTTSFQFKVPSSEISNSCQNTSRAFKMFSNFFDNVSNEVTSQVIFLQSDTEGGNVLNEEQIIPEVVGKEIKKEVEEINQKENSQESRELSEVNNNLIKCLDMLVSALETIKKKDFNKSEKIRESLKVLQHEIIDGTNKSVIPQITTEDNVDKNNKEVSIKCNNNEDGESQSHMLPAPPQCEPLMSTTPPPQPHPPQQPISSTPIQHEESNSSTPPQHQQSLFSTGYKYLESSLMTSYEANVVDKNVGTLALSMRLDSFEKRFDACLKEVGAIVSEMSHIKSEIKKIQDAISSNSGSTYSPGKSKGGFQQTTLNFGSASGSSSPYKSVNLSRDDPDSEEPEAKRSRKLKRKLSKSDSCSDFEDVILRIKTEAVDYTSFSIDKDDFVEVYTDGACHLNGKKEAKAGIGIWFGDSHPLNVSEPVCGSPTNNSAEIQAARVAIELAIKTGVSKLKIYTDSEFLINCITKWIHRWKRNGWTLMNGGQVKNKKELEKLDKIASRIQVRWEKVAGHAGIKGNEMADRLANEGASRYQR